MKRLYVGNLALDISAEEVRSAFSKFGTVISVTIAEDPHTGRQLGFGYVEMEEGDAAIAGLNRTDLRGLPLTVCGARPRNPEPEAGLLSMTAARSTQDAMESKGVLAARRALSRGDER